MMRSTLLFTLTLFLAACSDNATNDQSTKSDSSEKEAVVKQVTIQTEPVKTADKPAKIETAPISGYTFYAHKCASCHGKNGEKAAFNNAQIIAGWDKEKSIAALKGYKDGTYGKSLKGIMKGQVSALSDEQIEAVSEYISTL
ncbi:MAG: c-type cytochrome [Sulfurimonadaceae bacterium]